MAAQIAARLGLAEMRANARITMGIVRYQAGHRSGFLQLREVAEVCREQRLLALRRAEQNLAWAMIEEGDWPGSEALLARTAPAVQGGHNLTTGFSAEAQRAWFAGDWATFMTVADAIHASPSIEWDLQVRGLRTWIGLLRNPELSVSDGVPGLLAAGERSGFHRLRWCALAHGALCRANAGTRERGGGSAGGAGGPLAGGAGDRDRRVAARRQRRGPGWQSRCDHRWGSWSRSRTAPRGWRPPSRYSPVP